MLVSPKGKRVRADYTPRGGARSRSGCAGARRSTESPFERLLARVHDRDRAGAGRPAAARGCGSTLDQRPRGWARFARSSCAPPARRQVEGALDGLAELLGDEP